MKMRVKMIGALLCVTVLLLILMVPTLGVPDRTAYKMIDTPYEITYCRINWPYVVYREDRGLGTGEDIYCRNMNTGAEWIVSNQPNDEGIDQLSVSYITFTVNNGVDFDLWYHEIATRTSYPVWNAPGVNEWNSPIVSDRYILANISGLNDVIAYDALTGTYINVAADPIDTEVWVCYWQSWVAYILPSSSGTDWDAHLYNFATGEYRAFATGTDSEIPYDFDYGHVLYVSVDLNTSASSFYLYTISTGATSLVTASNIGWECMGDKFIVWEDDRNLATTGIDIYGYNIAAGTEFPICTAPTDQMFPCTYGSYAFWEDNRDDPDSTLYDWFTTNGTDAWDVYGKSLPGGAEFILTGAPDPIGYRLPVSDDKWVCYEGGDHRNAFTYGYTPPAYPPGDVYIYNYREGREYAVREKDSIKTYIRMTTTSPDRLISWIEEEAPGDRDIWGYWILEEEQFVNPVAAFAPVKNHHLAEVNDLLECITESLPEDVSDDIQDMLDGIQEHIGNANTTANTIYANNELLKAIELCEDVSELLGITCS